MGAAPKAFAGMSWTSVDSLFVRVCTDAGVEGWGEGWGHVACPTTSAALASLVAPAFVGRDVSDRSALMAEMAQSIANARALEATRLAWLEEPVWPPHRSFAAPGTREGTRAACRRTGHSREGGNPAALGGSHWIPACAGMTGRCAGLTGRCAQTSRPHRFE